MRELGDGRVELHLRLSNLSEVHRWLLKWGGDAIVTNPPQLEETVIPSGLRIAAEQEKYRALRATQPRTPPA